MFRHVSDAVRCALAIPHCTQKHNETRSDAEKLLLCVGIGHGEVLRISDTDIFGAEVDAACKLGEDIAKQGEILMTAAGARRAKLPPDTGLAPPVTLPAGLDSAFVPVYDQVSSNSPPPVHII